MERADLTMEDWIQQTWLISVVTSGPTEPFKEAWHSPIEKERDNWRTATRKEIRSMIDRGVWRETDRRGYLTAEVLLEISGYSKSREKELTGQDLLH